MPPKRSTIPEPPAIAKRLPLYRLKGDRVTRLWIMTDEGRTAFENQYVTAPAFSRLTGASRATAYRSMAEHYQQQHHIWWVIDWRNPDKPTQRQCLPRSLLRSFILRPRGNPHFCDGTYQKHMRCRHTLPDYMKP